MSDKTKSLSSHQLICTESDVDLYDIHNKPLLTKGIITLPIIYGNHVLHQEFIVTNGISESCVLGQDAAIKHEFIFDGGKKAIFLSRDQPVNLLVAHHETHVQKEVSKTLMTLFKNVRMAPLTSQVVEAEIQGHSDVISPFSLFLFSQSVNLPEGIVIQDFINECNEEGKYLIEIENKNNVSVLLPRKCLLGNIEFSCMMVGKVSTNWQVADAQDDDITIAEPISDLNVDAEFKKPITDLLHNFPNLFATENSELGSTGLIKHSIDTQGKGPIRLRPYRTGRKQKEELERQIKEMMATNVIQHSTSPWAAPVILVEKKSGELRFCIDYRKLNSLTKKDSFPLPRIDSTLDRLYGKKFFTTLDLASGYWQIELDDPSKEKTAFIVENNLYEFIRMPFGLCNAPATFQRVMNYILRDVSGIKALVYLDDVIIFSETFEDHLRDIKEVFTLIQNAGLKLKLKKCQFMKKSVQYLGHIISRDGIGPDPKTIEKIANYKTPISADEVRSFLGLAGYYRRFIPNFGSIAQPLTAKTHKDVVKNKFIWTDIDQKAFDFLRTCLITPPLLAYPDFNLEFLLFTDACDYGIGSVLSQMQDGVEKPIAYASRQLKPAERKYATVEKEALAVIFSIKHFRHYLLDKPFTVISDHRPLQWLENQKDNNGRLGRWAILLAGTNYKIRYRPGRIHQNADCLSRLHVSSIQIENSDIDILASQAADPLCQSIINYLDNGFLPVECAKKMPIWAKEIELYQLLNKVLYRVDLPTAKSRRNIPSQQVVLPLTLRPIVLKEFHDSPLSGGHLAFLRTYLKVKNNYYWPTMLADIKEYCKACVVCTANTKSNLRAYLFPHDLAKAPFQVIGIDFLGPISPVSPKGNNCICVITDYFTKFVIAVALPDQTAQTTAECIYKEVVLMHGPPLAMVSDRGTNFTSKLMRYFCKKLNIEQRFTTAYNPASNGETERFNRTMTTMLRKELVDGHHDDWEDVLGEVCFAYRSSIHSSTNESPYYMCFGRDVNFPINKILGAVPDPVPSSNYVDTLLERLRYSFQRANEYNVKARLNQKKQYDKRAKIFNYKPGDRVLLDIRQVKKGDNRKFTSKFKGPYRVIKIRDNHTVEIADSSFKPQLVHCNRLKPLYETMLWTDEPMPNIIPAADPRERSRKHIYTQTNLDMESSDENDRSDDSSDSERSDSSSLSSSSLSIVDDDLNDISVENPDFDNTSLIDPEILERTISPVIIPHPPPLSPVITIVNEKENNLIPPELPRLRSRSAIKPRSRLIMEI